MKRGYQQSIPICNVRSPMVGHHMYHEIANGHTLYVTQDPIFNGTLPTYLCGSSIYYT